MMPPILWVPEYKGGASLILPPTLKSPKYEGNLSNLHNYIVPDEGCKNFEVETVNEKPIIKSLRQLQNIPTVERLEKEVEKLQGKTIVKESRLANTGENSTNAMSVGGIMLVSGIILGIKRRKKKSNMFLKITI